MAKRDVIVPTPALDYNDWTVSVSWTVDDDWTYHKAYTWIVDVTESLFVKEGRLIKDPTHKINDSFSITDHEKKVYSFDLNKYTPIKVSETFGQQLTFIRKYSEILNCACHHGNFVTKPFKSSFSVYDTLGRAGNAVISDVIFEGGEWNMDSVVSAMVKGKPAGYTAWTPFIYGDYTYKDALFRTALTSDGGTRAVIEQYRITVDVPDITDRGGAEVVDKNYDLRVEFNKKFHAAPEVNITMRSGSSSAPIVANVTTIDEEGFEMFLINMLTGERATGKFIWTAIGY